MVQQAINARVDGPILVMEDDCQFTPDAVSRIQTFMANLPDGWEVAYLGSSTKEPAGSTVGPGGVVRARGLTGTHAVIIHPRAFKLLLDRWATWDTHVDWSLRDMAREEPERQFYAISPYVAIQMANLSTITGAMAAIRSWDDRVPVAERPASSVPVVMPRGTKAQIDALRAAGDYHTGYWRDEATGYDRGLMAIVNLPAEQQAAKLAAWIKVVRDEAAAFPAACVGVWHPSITVAMLTHAVSNAAR